MAQSEVSVEQLVKTGTAILAILFILGFLISNLHLMAFGVSDFTSFNSRNVMIGALFLIWLMLLILPILPILFVVYLWRIKALDGWFSGGLWAFGTAAAILSLICMSGIIVGFLNPWGRSWDQGMVLFTSGPMSWIADFRIGFDQFLENFANLKTGVGAFALTFAGIVFVIGFVGRKTGGQPLFDFHVAGYGYWMEIVYAALASGLLLSGYAQSVYPNMIYNLGGGQPAIAEIVLDIPPEDRAVQLPGILAETRNASTMVQTEPLVIWHQSDKFLHVRPLSQEDAGTLRLMSITLSDVKTILYLNRVARFDQGGVILDIDPK